MEQANHTVGWTQKEVADHMHVEPVTLSLPRGVAELRPLELSHAQGLFEAAQDADAWRFMPAAQPQSEQEMRARMERDLETQETGTELPFVVMMRASGRIVGTTRYMDIQGVHRNLEIGSTWLNAEARRTSVNTECKYLLFRHAFDTLGAARVFLKTDARNQRSQKAILRVGALYEGCLRKSRVLHDGFVRDTMYYSVIDEEWPGVRTRLEHMLGLA